MAGEVRGASENGMEDTAEREEDWREEGKVGCEESE